MLCIINNYTLQTLCGEPHKVCNDEGKLLGLTPNRLLKDAKGEPYDMVCGTFFFGQTLSKRTPCHFSANR